VVTTSRPSFKSNRNWLIEYARRLEEDGILQIYEGLSKQQYHSILKESKVMLTNSIEENFGYSLIEACLYDTIPVAKNKYSHPELLQNNSRLLFNCEDEILEKIEWLMVNKIETSHYAKKYFTAMDNILKHMKLS
jgi:UDP-N-acetylglucosamine 2-epimerase